MVLRPACALLKGVFSIEVSPIMSFAHTTPNYGLSYIDHFLFPLSMMEKIFPVKSGICFSGFHIFYTKDTIEFSINVDGTVLHKTNEYA